MLFPGGTSVLQVFEPRYLQMVKDCMQNESGFGVCLLKDEELDGEEETIFDVGTYATIYDFEKLDNGMLGLHCRGNDRFKVKYDGVENELHHGIVEWWPDSECPDPPVIMRPCAEYLVQASKRSGLQAMRPGEYDSEDLADPNWISYRLAELLPLTNRSRQTILEMDDAALKLKTLYAVVQTIDHGTRLS